MNERATALTAEFRPNLRLGIRGSAAVLRHFSAEYGPALTSVAGRDADVEVDFVASVRRRSTSVIISGGHKTVRWNVAIPVVPERLAARIAVQGRPMSFALSLVQGYFVEPLTSLAAAAAGHALLPGSGICVGDEAMLVFGRSRSGKSTLTARALASGHEILGDDQVLVDGSGNAWSFPRRMRFYSDLRVTAPEAHARLPLGDRLALAARRVGVIATRGSVAPPIRVPADRLGGRVARAPRRIARVVIIERLGTVGTFEVSHPSSDSVVELVMPIIDEQRSRLAHGAPAGWARRLAAARTQEAALLRQVLDGVAVERYAIPAEWDARRASDELRARLGLSAEREARR